MGEALNIAVPGKLELDSPEAGENQGQLAVQIQMTRSRSLILLFCAQIARICL